MLINKLVQVQAGVEIVKDKHELVEAQLRLSKLQISNAGQQSESPIFGLLESVPQVGASSMPYNPGPPFHHSNPFSQNITPITQHGSYYQPSSQQHVLSPPPPHQQPQLPHYQPSPLIQFSQPTPLTCHPNAPPYVQSADFLPSSSNSRIKDPTDDLVDKVNSMGFPKDLVRSTIMKLTNDRQAIDLNLVLDKLMTDGLMS